MTRIETLVAILVEHDEAEKEARKKGKKIKPKYIEVD